MSPKLGRERVSHRDLRRALDPIDIRAGLYELKGQVRTVNRSRDRSVFGLIDKPDNVTVRYHGEGLHGFEVGREVHLEGCVDIHPEWGAQYRVLLVMSSMTPKEARGLKRYMAGNIPGVGAVWAGRMIDTFGPRVLAKLYEDPGIVTRSWPDSAQAQRVEFGVKAWIRSTTDEVWAYRVGPDLMKAADISYEMARRICDFFTGAEVADLVVRRDPYRLLDVPGLGWKRVDAIALSVGVSETSIERYEGAVRAALSELPLDGSMAFLRSELIENTVGRTGGDRKLASRAIAMTVMGGELLRFRGALVPPEQYDLSWQIADTLLSWSAPLDPTEREQAKLERVLSGRRLTDEQKAGVRGTFANSVFLLAGGPGSGKTFTLETVVEAASVLDIPVTIVAPTGTAARRASEATGHEVQTIHSALGGPVGMDAKSLPPGLLIVEESSLLDEKVAAWLVRHCDIRRTQLLLVGDDKQLPPVGPGAVFRDVIRSNRFPMQNLTGFHRQAQVSPFIRAAHAIRTGGRLPTVEDQGFNFLNLPTDPDVALNHLIAELGELISAERRSESRALTEGGRFDPRKDLQILTTRHGGPLGTGCLNQRMQSLVNPAAAQGPPVSGGLSVRVGDRLICNTTDYSIDEGVCRGEQGRAVNVSGNRISVEMDDGRTVITDGPVQNGIWALAYSITVHESEGSEYPIVVVLLHSSQLPDLDRDILYTGLTCAKRTVLLAGDEKGFGIAENHVNARRTVLADILCKDEQRFELHKRSRPVEPVNGRAANRVEGLFLTNRA